MNRDPTTSDPVRAYMTDDLPPLPEYSMSRHPMSIRFDAEQMQAYAREAIRSDRDRMRAAGWILVNTADWERRVPGGVVRTDAIAPVASEPVGFVMGWHVTVGDPHADVRLDVRLYSGRHHQFKTGDHIYAHPPALSEEFIQEAMRLAYRHSIAFADHAGVPCPEIEKKCAALEAHLRGKG